MTDLKVDANLLGHSIKSLAKIKSEFDHTHTHQHGLEHLWGSSKISKAMDGFADNWDYHRKHIIESIVDVTKLANKCLDSFGGLDTKLDKKLKDAHKKKTKG